MNIRIVFAAFALAAFTVPAVAQMPSINMMPDVKSRSPEEKERDAQIEKAYKESLKKIPNSAPTDPWGNVRGQEASAPAKPKPAKPKADPSRTTAQPKQLKGSVAN